MLPENQFHAAVSSTIPRGKERSNFYTTQQVLDLTLMSRFTLIRKTKEGIFPSPVNPGSKGSNYYVKKEVDDWVKNNIDWVKTKEIKTKVTVKFEAQELKDMREAAALIGCTLDKFINDAAVWKAKRIITQYQREQNTEYCS
tara:strand:- start:483 stop:908 length:426 start_codon:yes stop_codon:yes gene_type:complete